MRHGYGHEDAMANFKEVCPNIFTKKLKKTTKFPGAISSEPVVIRDEILSNVAKSRVLPPHEPTRHHAMLPYRLWCHQTSVCALKCLLN
jgi:hypothetical protein